jgi:hypothetical protein
MGTRNLTCVFHEGTYKIAKYGQWDGYPDHLGVNILDFLLNRFEKETFIKNLGKVRFISDEELKSLWQKAGSDNSGWVNMEVSENFKKSEYPLSRDCSGFELLSLIQHGKVDKQINSVDFAGDGLFCEWCYVIDLDKNTFEVYKGFNKITLDFNERFSSIRPQTPDYSPVKHVKTYQLNNLPDKSIFLKDVDEDNS